MREELIAAVDIGTNSVRMSLVRLDLIAGTWTLLSQHKETVRLGQGEFGTGQPGHITEAAMERGVTVLRQFAQTAQGRGAREIVAVGTAALREAENRAIFIERARVEAGVEVQVVSGIEEARLIYLGVASGVEIGDRNALFIDIGGGSTELIIGTQTEHRMLDSLKLGAIRVANLYLNGVTMPIDDELYEAMRQFTRSALVPAQRRIHTLGFDLAIASSGTAVNLSTVSAKRAESDGRRASFEILSAYDLKTTSAHLRSLTLDERRRVGGLNPERADIIVAGAAILETILDEMQIAALRIADRSLREGIIVDAINRRRVLADNGIGKWDGSFEAGVRLRSVEALLRLTNAETDHAHHVADIALQLFDSLQRLGSHNYDHADRDLLEYAALLHDIGIFISHTGHHRHSHYLIQHSELAGFTNYEKAVIANLAYFHRKSPPKKRHMDFQALPPDAQQIVRRLSTLLRLAEGLDRSHLGLVEQVKFLREESDEKSACLVLQIMAQKEPEMELLYVSGEKPLFEDAWGMPLRLEPTVVSSGKK